MKFLNKKIFLLIIIIVIFIIITGIVAVFYWQKLSIFEQESIPAEQESTEEELTQLEKDCLEEHDKMTQDEFLESIKVENLSFYESLTPEEVHERMHLFDKTKVGYLICSAKYTEDESFYDKAKEYILGERNISDEIKQATINQIAKIQEGNKEISLDTLGRLDILNLLAFASLDELCPVSLTQECHKNISSVDGFSDDFCDTICEFIENALNDESHFNDNIIGMKRLRFESESIELGQYVQIPKIIGNLSYWRIGFAFRIGGRDVALQMCNGFEEEQACKDFINNKIDFLERVKLLSESSDFSMATLDNSEFLKIKYEFLSPCSDTREYISDLVCKK